VVLRHACKLGFEGIVSKRLSAPHRSGPSRDWIKVKNPDSPAMGAWGHHGNDHGRVFRALALVDGHRVGRDKGIEFAEAVGHCAAIEVDREFASVFMRFYCGKRRDSASRSVLCATVQQIRCRDYNCARNRHD
jgi:hypothetical protein